MRFLLVLIHRYLGLAMAVFLAMAGLTGSILAFHHEIDEWLNPQFYSASGAGTPLGLAALAERAAANHPQLDILYIESEGEHPALAVGQAWPDPQGGAVPELDYNWVYLDPVTGETVGTRYWARCCFEAENFIPFLYEFHHSLTLPGIWGYLVMGVVAIAWTLDCVIALVLTFPNGRPFLAKWKTAWQVKRGGGSYRLNFDLHRAGGLWLWLILLPIAISSIAMNLPDQVFQPVVDVFSPVEQNIYYQRQDMSRDALGETRQSYADIVQRGREEAEAIGLNERLYAIYFNRPMNYYAAGFGDHDAAGLGSPWLFFDGGDGRLVQRFIPGEGSAGDIFVQLQFPIHGGRIAGFAGRVVICVTGLVIFMLSVTGIVIWWKKRGARLRRATKTWQKPALTERAIEQRPLTTSASSDS